MVQAQLEKGAKIGHGNSVFDMRSFDDDLPHVESSWLFLYERSLDFFKQEGIILVHNVVRLLTRPPYL